MFLTRVSDRPGRRPGTVAVMVAVCLAVLLAVTAITLDGGWLYSNRRQVQAAADAAALAAACNLYANWASDAGADPHGTAALSAKNTAAADGYNNDGTTSVVTVNIPPTSGDYVGQSGYAEVIITYYQPRHFSRIFGSGNLPVKARAVAFGGPIARSTWGFLVLDPSAANAFYVAGTPTTLTGASIMVDSSSSSGAVVAGNASLTCPALNVVGGYSVQGNATVNATVHTGQPSVADPLASVPAPDPNSMTVQSSSTLNITSNQTLSPGVYKGGINISGGTVTLSPGVYYMQGGGFVVSGQATVNGGGVMIYNAPNDDNDTMSVSGGASVNISAPTSGTYMGIAVFQARGSDTGLYLAGGSTTTITGTVYAPSGLITVTGNSTSAVVGSQYITKDLTIQGNAGLNVSWNLTKVARTRNIYLVE